MQTLSLLFIFFILRVSLCDVVLNTSDGRPTLLRDVAIPFNNLYLPQAVSGPLVTNDMALQILNSSRRGSNFVLLCNVTVKGLHFERSCDDEVARNASVVIGYPSFIPQYPGKNYYYIVRPPAMAPMIELNDLDYLFLIGQAVNANWTLEVTVYPNHGNPWIEASNSVLFIFWQVVISSLQFGCICAAVLCLYLLPKTNFPMLCHVVLILELFANSIRFIYFAVDPLYTRLIFPYYLATLLQTISIPFSLASSLLIGLFWYGAVNKRMMRGKRKKEVIAAYLRVPCYVTIGVVFAIEIVCDLVRIEGGAYFVQIFLKLNAVIVFLVLVFIFGFYIFTGFKLVKTLKENKSQSKVLVKMKKLLMAISFVVFGIMLVCIGIISPLYWSVAGYYGLWMAGNLAFTLLSIIHIVAFWPPAKNTTVQDPSQQLTER